jgi:hypothetical protein
LSTVTLEAVILRPGTDASTLTRPGLFLDRATLDSQFRALGEGIGAVAPERGRRHSLAVARRLSLDLARRYGGALPLSAEALAAAWFFPLWTEVCTLLPVRQVARRLVRDAGGAPILVPISVKPAAYLGYWGPNALEPLLLAAAVDRSGGTACLVFEDAVTATSDSVPDEVALRFEPSALWATEDGRGWSGRVASSVLVSAGMRCLDQVLGAVSGALEVQCGFSPPRPPGTDVVSLPPAPLPRPVELAFRRTLRTRALQGEGRAFSCETVWDLGARFAEALTETTRGMAGAAAHLVDDLSLRVAHVCDHLFFEGTLVAHAVSSRGGRVVVWPHSSNAVHVEARPESPTHEVYAATSSAAEQWRARFPRSRVHVASELLLETSPGPRPLKPDAPITLVLFSGAHVLNRMPILRLKSHTGCYRRLFRALAAPVPGVRLLCKAKSWESMEWLRSLAGPSAALEETTESALAIDEPNLVFMSVSFGSTALLEGLGRGIPCMVVREGALEDYTAIDPAFIPVGDVPLILETLCRLRDPTEFDRITRRQLEWYRNETNFGGIRLARTPEAGTR